ncbi:MAG: hypothetical protein WDW38_002681 [Sanguina aurantia]
MKRTVQYRTTRYPEQVIANEELLRRALAIAKLYSRLPLRTVAELTADSKTVEKRTAVAFDPLHGAVGASALRDCGVRPTLEDWNDVIQPELVRMLASNPCGAAMSFLQRSFYEQLSIHVHREVTIRGEFCISSSTLRRQTVCESVWVLSEFLNEADETYFQPGKVERYVRVRLPDSESGEPCFLRAALCTFWTPLTTWVDRDIGDPVYRFFHEASKITNKGYAISLDCIRAPMLRTHESLPVMLNRVMQRRDHYLLTTYSFLSGVKQ